MRHDTQADIDRYATNHIPTGSFLAAVLANDLEQAIARADEDNLRDLPEIVTYVVNHVPRQARGSFENLCEWIKTAVALDRMR